jgi:hypothetical protein
VCASCSIEKTFIDNVESFKIFNVGTVCHAYRVAVRGIEQNPSFLGATGKRFHSPFPQKPKKRAKTFKGYLAKERLEFKNADSENIDSEEQEHCGSGNGNGRKRV